MYKKVYCVYCTSVNNVENENLHISEHSHNRVSYVTGIASLKAKINS